MMDSGEVSLITGSVYPGIGQPLMTLGLHVPCGLDAMSSE